MSKYVLGLDIGTSACKSILVDDNGQMIAKQVGSYPFHTPKPGWVEQDPREWWSVCVDTIRRLLRSGKARTREIAAVGLSAQMHGLVVVDAEGSVVRPAILWNDQRTGPQCEQIYELVGGKDALLDVTNNAMLPGYTAPKILWLQENEPWNYERAHMFLNPKDYLRFVLTGEFATDVSDASGTGLFNVEERKWSERLIKLLGIPLEKLPMAYESTTVVGRVSAKAAQATGLAEGLPVVAGGGDAVIQTTGSGLMSEGILGTIIGTAGVVAMGLSKFRRNSHDNLQIFCNNAPDTWHVMGVTLTAGGAYSWFKDALCSAEVEKASIEGRSSFEVLETIAASAPPGSRNLIYLPYLNGERCPYADPTARGAFVGLSLQHGRSEFTRSVMEGVVFSLRQVFEAIKRLGDSVYIEEIRSSGGGSISPLWRQIQADIFQVPVKTVSGSAEGGAYGASLVAGTGCGFWSSLQEAAGILTTETETVPNRVVKTLYDDLYDVYTSLYPALRGVNQRLAKT